MGSRGGRTRTRRGRRLCFERLEDRSLLAAPDLALIGGYVFHDANGNGFTPGEQVVGAALDLYRDVNGNGVLDAGDGAALATATTDANGAYRFSRLTEGNYFVKQAAQTVSGVVLTEQISALIPISASAAQGVLGTPIDSFDTQQIVLGRFPVGTVGSSSEMASEALGGKRDLIGVMTAGASFDSVTVFSGNNRLAFFPTFGATGTYTIVWDGRDGVGLGGGDLTAAGRSTHVQMSLGTDKPGGVATLRIDSGAVLSDSFDHYDLDAWPPNWSGDGNSSTDRTNNRVVADPTNPDNHVLKLHGVVGGNWGANAYRQYAFPETFTLETAIYNGEEPLSGGHPYRGCIELRQGTFWGNPERHLLVFDNHHNVTDANGRILQSYQTNRWYHVKIGYHRIGTDLTLHYWIDGIDRGVTQLTISDLAREQSFDHVNLTANEGTAYFDNLRITDQNNWSQAQVNLADTTGQPDRVYSIDLENDLQIGGNNGANITNVNAVSLEIAATSSAMAGQMTVIDTRGPSVFTADFPNVNVADLSLTKTVDNDRPNVGETVMFTVALNNLGPSAATGVTVRDSLESSLTFVSAAPSHGTFDRPDPLRDLFYWNVGQIAAGTTATLQVTARVDAANPTVNTAEVARSDQFDPNSTPGNNERGENDQASASVTPQIADLSLTKTVDKANPNVGEQVEFTVTVSNRGPDTATGVLVRDPLPQGLKFVSAAPSQGAYSEHTGIWAVGSIANGSQATLTVAALVETADPKTNVAEVSTSDQYDPNSTPNNSISTEDDQAEAKLEPQFPPVITVSLDNQTPRTNDVLLATAAKSGTEGRTVSLTFVWKVNGVERRTFTSDTALTDTFDLGIAGQGDRGDRITVEVTPTSGTNVGASVVDSATVGNSTPVLDPIDPKSVDELATLQFAVSATDPDLPRDALTYNATDLPPGATFDPATGEFSWTPTESQQGQYVVTFTATDDGTPNLSDSQTVTITVREVNAAPVLAPIGDRSVDEHTQLQFTVSAEDPDDIPANNVTLSATGLPSGARFDPATGKFSWTPTESQQGQYVVTFTATDDGTPNLSDSETVTITVVDIPLPIPPVIEPLDEREIPPPIPPRPLPKPPDVVPHSDSRTLAFALSGSGSASWDWGTEGAIHDLATSPAELLQIVLARLHALAEAAARELKPADTALLEIMATDPEPLRLVAFDLGDEPPPPDPLIDPATKPEDPPRMESPDAGPMPRPDGMPSAITSDDANRLLWLCLPGLLVAAGAAWYWRKTWRKWFVRIGWPAALAFLVALCAARPAGWAGEPGASSFVIAKARQYLARGEHRQAHDELRAEIDRLGQTGAPATQRLGLFDLLADVQSASGLHQQSLCTRVKYQAMVESAAFLSDASRARILQQSRAKLADTQANAGNLEEAEQTWRAVFNAEKQVSAANPLDPARWRLKHARAIAAGGDPERAKACFADAEQAARRVLEAVQQGDVERVYAAEASLVLAECFGARQCWPEAIAALDALLAQQGPDHPARRATLCELARYQHAAGDYAAEQCSLDEALRLVRGSAPDESLETMLRTAEIWDRWGHSAQAQQDRPGALAAWEKAAEAYRRARSHTAPEPTDGVLATALRNLREVYLQSGDEKQACDAAQELVKLFDRTRLPNDPEAVSARACLAGLFVRTKQSGEYPEYKDHLVHLEPELEDARDYWKRRQPPQPLELAAVLNILGEVARENGDVHKAAELFRQAFDLCKGVLPARDPMLAEVAVNLGAVHAARGEYDIAHKWYQQALEIRGRDATTPRAAEAAHAAYLNLAMLYKSQGRFDQALRRCEQAWQESQTLDERHSRTFTYHYTSAALHLAKAAVAPPTAPKADLGRALKHGEIAEAAVAKGMLSDFDGELAYLRGSILFRQGRTEEATGDWNKALQISRTTGRAALQARILTRLCEAELCLLAPRPGPQPGDTLDAKEQREAVLKRADDYAQQAITLHRQTNAYPSLHFSALVYRAQIVRALAGSAGDDDWRNSSRALLRQAVELTAGPRAMTTGAESERAQFFAQYALAFDLLVDWCSRDGQPWEALRYAEASRNRTFLDQVRAAGIDFGKSLQGGRYEDLLDERQDARNQYAALHTQTALAAAQTEQQQAERLAQQLEDCRETLWDLEEKIRNHSPLYRDVLVRAEALPEIEELRRIAPRPGELILLYHLGARRRHLFVLSGEDEDPLVLRLETDPDGAETLDVRVQRYLTHLRQKPDAEGGSRGPGKEVVTSDKSDTSGKSDTSEQARGLTEILLPAAVRERLTQHPRPQRLIVIPDGALHQLPFEALVWPSGDVELGYVLDHAPPIVYAPSLQIQDVLRNRDTARAAERSLLTVGMATFSAHQVVHTTLELPPRTGAAGIGASLEPLPATRDECRAVEEACRRAGFVRINPLLDSEATEQRVREVLEQSSVLHFATHAWVDPRRDNCFGALALMPPGPDGAATAQDDGLLEHHEIHGLSLTRCDLAVLSACRTNTGPPRPLEASSTLTRAFLSAGARSVVSSLWGADDNATSLLVAEFFGNLETAWKSGQPVDYAAALHQARRSLRREADHEAPYYWAPLILIGPGDEIHPR